MRPSIRFPGTGRLARLLHGKRRHASVAGAFAFAAALSSSLPRFYLLVLVEDVCRRCFQLRYLSQSLDRIGCALHAMGDAFEQYNRPAEPFETSFGA